MRLWPQRKSAPETRDSLENPSVSLIEALTAGSAPVASGVSVNQESALNFIAVYAAVRILSEGVASLPFHVYQRSDRSRIRISDDPRAFLLDEQPNPEQTAFELWESVMGFLNLWGNAYLYQELNEGNGLARSLWLLRPDRTRPIRNAAGEKVFVTYLDSGEERILLPDEVIHFRAFGTGDVGISPIGVARSAIGIGIAADEYAGRFFSNDARPGGVIQYQGKLSDEQWRQAMSRWKEGHRGLSNSHLTAILDNGAEWRDVGIPPQDAQFLETRKFQIREVARLFNVQPYKLADLESGTVSYASVEAQQIDWVQHSLRPWLRRIEQQVKRTMFGSELDRRKGLYAEFLVEGVLRGDTKSRFQSYAIAIQNGWLSPADVREKENEPWVEGLDKYTAPGLKQDTSGDMKVKPEADDEDE